MQKGNEKAFAAAKREYIATGESYAKIAKRHGLSLSSVKRRAAAEKWVELRTKAEPRLTQRTIERYIERAADADADAMVAYRQRVDRVLARFDRVMDDAERMLTGTRTTQHISEKTEKGTKTQENVADWRVIVSTLSEIGQTLRMFDGLRNQQLDKAAELLGGVSSAIDE